MNTTSTERVDAGKGPSPEPDAQTVAPGSEPAAAGAAQSNTTKTKPKVWVRLVVLFAALFTAWHILASFLWIAPYSQNAREIVPGNQKTLTAYMIPFFGQSWSVFAPEPINGDYHLNVRATLADGSETGWVSATDVELSMIQYNLFPPRGGIQSSEVASSYKSAYDSIEGVQRAIIEGDFVVDQWEVGLRAALESQHPSEQARREAEQAQQAEEAESAEQAEEGEGSDEGETTAEGAVPEETAAEVPPLNTAQIDEMLAEERRTTAYATQVARAIWGEDVTSVQFRVSRQNIIPFAERHNPHAERPAPTIVLPGWRAPIIEDGQNDENFARVFRSQFERIAS